MMRYHKEAISRPVLCKSHNIVLIVRRFTLLLASAITLLGSGNGHAQAADAPPNPPSAAQSTQEADRGSTTTEALERFTHDYWQQRVTEHAQRLNWHGYELQIEVSIPTAANKLTPCRQAYQPEANASALPVGQQRLRLRCPDKPGWTVIARSQIAVVMPVVIARVALEPDNYVQQGDLLLAPILLTAQHGDVLTAPEQAVGRRPQRALRPGQPIRNRMLEAALLVHKGSKVRLEMSTGEMSISMQGTALQDGQKGETISVRNERSGKIISAQVTGMNVLRLHGDPAPASLPQH